MSDSEDEETTFKYGTPLEPIDDEESAPPKKKLLQDKSEQYAVDSHGLRRFHGAFTGGFSAGFGNSVGTPEGFTPATFKSSRSEKALTTGQRPEDFMDEEDRSEFGIAPRILQTQNDFSGKKRTNQRRYHDGPIPGDPVLENLLRPVHETVAVKILKTMGWRPGQGAGERVTLSQKRKCKKAHKVYGCQLPAEFTQHRQETIEVSGESSSDSEFEYSTLFAPDDYEPYILKQKNDRFGLGYSGLSRHSVLGSLTGEYGKPAAATSHLQLRDKGKKVSIRGQAFGVGALEEDDDGDIYANEDMSNYDFTLGGSTSAGDKKKTVVRQSGVLEGFVKSTRPLPKPPAYPPPALPRGYQPTPLRSRFEPTTIAARDQGLGRHELSSEARGALLGETTLPKQQEKLPETTQTNPTETQTKTTTFDPKAVTQDAIAKILGRNVNFVTQKLPIENKEQDFISISNSNKSNVFKPFAGNPEKQMRYENYLLDKSSVLKRDSGIDRLSKWERDREVVEFEQAAKLYKPLSGFIEDRFTHATEPDDATNPLQAVTRSKQNRGLATQEQIDAAAKGLYGVMTRVQTTWRPEGLICKRFNVPDPFEDRPEPSKKDEKNKVSYSIFEYLESSVHNKETFSKEQSTFSGSKSVVQEKGETAALKNPEKNIPKNINFQNQPTTSTTTTQNITDLGTNKRLTVAELFIKETQKDCQDTQSSTAVNETIEKFDRMELYKAIFLSDSEDEDKGSENQTKTAENNEIVSYKDYVDVPKNVERNKSPPRGIFANIDFDELNSWNKITEKAPNIDKNKDNNDTKESPKNINSNNEKDVKGNDLEVTEMYGPKIPENLQNKLQIEQSSSVKEIAADFRPKFRSKTDRDGDKVVEIDSSTDSESWVEAGVKEKKHKKKKSKKHKSKHKKSKHKKKSH